MKGYLIKVMLLTSLIFSSSFQVLRAQEDADELQVITKTVRKTILANDSDSLIILAEKSNITISGWKKNEIELVLKLTSKHENKKLALKELEYLDYKISQEKGKITLSNYFVNRQSFKEVRGVLSATYELKIPQNLPLKIINKYGSVSISNLANEINAEFTFIEFTSNNCQGRLFVKSIFGSNDIISGEGQLEFQLQKSDIEINSFTGSANVSGKYGKVKIFAEGLTNLDVSGDKTEVELWLKNMKAFNYELNTTYSKIQIPALSGNELQNNNQYIKHNKTTNATLKVSTTYKPITLNLLYNAKK